MELTTINYRKLKNILSMIPGAPASSQLAEAIARGLGYQDHNDLRADLSVTDTSFGRVDLMEPNIDMLEALKEYGVGKFEAMDIMATMMAVSSGEYLWEDIDANPELFGAGVIRYDVTTPEWRAAAKTGWEAFAAALDIGRIEVRMPENWADAMNFADIDHVIRIGDAAGTRMRHRTGEGILNEDEVDMERGYVLEGFVENIIIHARSVLPGYETYLPPALDPEGIRSGYVEKMVIDTDGIRFLCKDQSQANGAEVWIARFHGGPVRREWLGTE